MLKRLWTILGAPVTISQFIAKHKTVSIVLLSLFMIIICNGSVFAQTAVYYSVGTDTSDLKNAATVTIAAGVATFSAAQSDNIGVGDEIDYDVDNKIMYISGRTSSTVYSVTTATGGAPGNITAKTVNSIERAFNTLNGAETNAGDASHLNDSDITGAGADVQLNLAIYKDGVFTDTNGNESITTIDGWTTSTTNYIRMYAPYLSTEVGVSQRHTGVEGTGVVFRPSNSTPGAEFQFIYVRDNHVRIEGLEIDGTNLTNGEATYGGYVSSSVSGSGSDIRFEDLIIHDISSTASSGGIAANGFDIRDGQVRISNSIIYDISNTVVSTSFGSWGIDVSNSGGDTWIHNVTIYNVSTVDGEARGINRASGPVTVKNCFVGKISGPTHTGYSGTMTEATNVSYDTTATGTTGDSKTDYSTYFVESSSTNTDLHIKDSAFNLWGLDGTDLDADAELPVTKDIDLHTRHASTPDIGADEFTFITYVWDDGAGDDNWDNPTNWDQDLGYPDDVEDVVYINSGSDTITTPTGTLNIGGLTLGSSFSGTLSLGGTLDVDGSFSIEGGAFQQNDNNLFVSGTFSLASGVTFTKATTGTLYLDGDQTYFDGTSPQQDVGRVVADPTTTLTSNLTASSLTIVTNDTLVTDGYNIDISGTMDINGTLDASSGTGGTTQINVGGSWDNSGGLFTSGDSSVIFDGTTTDLTISGTLGGSSSFYKVDFNGSGGEWTIDGTMVASAANETDTFDVSAGTVTLGDGGSDALEVRGGFTIASGATFQTYQNLTQSTGTITIDINENTSSPSCANCIVSVSGNMDLGPNTVLRLNPSTGNSDTGIEVQSSGYFEVAGSLNITGSLTAVDSLSLRETTLCANETYTADEHNAKHVRISNYSSLAFGRTYKIQDTMVDDSNCAINTHDSLVITDETSDTDTAPNVQSGASCSTLTRCTIEIADTLITTNNQANGRYLHNITNDEYYLIGDSVEAATDTLIIIDNSPDDILGMDDSDDVEITDGIRSNDSFEVMDYAHVTAEDGVACTSTVAQANEGYVYLLGNSEALFQYADVCNLGRSVSTKEGIRVNSVDGDDANEGATLIKSRFHSSYYGLYFTSFLNNTISDNSSYSNSQYGILFFSGSSNNSVSGNRIYENGSNGLWLFSSPDNTFSNNVVSGNSSVGIQLSSNSNRNIFKNNYFSANNNYGLNFGSSNYNTLIANHIYGNASVGYYASQSNFGMFSSNNILGNATHGVSLVASNDNVFVGPSIYGNASYGMFLDDVSSVASSGNIVISGSFGVLGDNILGDVDFQDTPAHNLTFYNVSLASTTSEVGSNVDDTDQYIISYNHDGTLGLTRVWGEYTIPSDDSETLQNEGSLQMNYADASWPDSFTAHQFSGTGAEDTDLDFTIDGVIAGSSDAYIYRLVCEDDTAENCDADAGSWSVYRYDDTGSETQLVDADYGGAYVDATTNVGFKIDGGGGTDYDDNDVYTFAVWKAATNTNTRKTLTMMQTGDVFAVTGTQNFEMVGSLGSPTVVQKDSGSTSYAFNVSGIINANYFSISGGDASGLNIQSGATVEMFNNGTFDNSGGVGGSDTYVSLHKDVIDTAGAESWTGLMFDAGVVDSNIENNIILSGGSPSSCANQWTFGSSGNLGGSTLGEANDSDVDGDCSSLGYLLWGTTLLTYTWDDGAGDDNWNSPLNWDQDSGYPSGSGDTVIINTGSDTIPTPVETINISSLTLGSSFSGILSLGGTLDVDGTFKMDSGTFQQNTNDVYVSGTFSLASGVTFIKATTGTLYLDGDQTYFDGTSPQQDVGHVVADPTTTLTSNFTATSLTIPTDDTMVTDGYNIDISGTMDIDGTLDASSGTGGASSINVGGNWNNDGVFSRGNSTVTFDGLTGTVDLLSGGSSFNHLIIDDGGNALTVELEDSLDVNGTLTITDGTLDTKSSENNSLNLGGSLLNSDTIIFNNSNVVFDAASGIVDILSGGVSFYNLTFNDGGGNATFELEDNIDINGTLTITGGTFDTNSAEDNDINIAGSWINNDMFVVNNSTVTFDGVSGTVDLQSNGDSFVDLIINDSGGSLVVELEDALDVNGTLTITDGSLDAKSGEDNAITLAGHWINNDTFTSQGGSVTLDGTDQSILGSTTFYNLTKIESSDDSTDTVVTFDNTGTLTISNIWTFQGLDADDQIQLRSDSSGMQWGVSPTGTRNLQYLDVEDSYNSSGATVVCTLGCTDSLNNFDWSFTPLPVDVTGRVYSDKGTTAVSSGITIALSINGAAAVGTDDTDGSGDYTINGTFVPGDVLAFYIDDETIDGVTVTVATGTVMTGLDIYQDYLIVRQDNGGALSNADLNTANNNGDTDIDELYTMSSNELTVVDNKVLFVPSGQMFQPADAIIADDIDVEGQIDLQDIDLTVSGDWVSTGTISEGTSTITFDGSTGTPTINTNGYPFASMVLNDGGGNATFEFVNAIDVNGTFRVIDGIVDFDTNDNNVNISGNIIIDGGSLLPGSGISTFDGDLTYADNVGGTNFGDVVIGSSPDTTTLTTDFMSSSLTIATGDAFITDGYEVTITNFIDINGTLDASDGTDGRSLITLGTYWDATSGNVFPGKSTVEFNASSGVTDIISDGNAFYNVTIDDGAGTATFEVEDGMDINGTLFIDDGSLDTTAGESNSINIAGNWVNNDIFTVRSSTVTFDGTLAQTVTAAGSNFRDIVIQNSSSGGVTFADTFDAVNLTGTLADSVITFNAGDTYTLTGVLNLNGGAGGDEIILSSDSGGSSFTLNVTAGTQNVSYVSVKDSEASSNDIRAAMSINAGGNDDGGTSPQWVFTGTVTDMFTDITGSANLGTTAGGGTVVILDCNNDSYLDVLMNDDTTDTVRLRQNDGDNTFTDRDSQITGAGSGYNKGAGAGDFDNDGDMDLVIGTGDNLYSNTAAVNCTFTRTANPSHTDEAQMFADIDSDGDLDVWNPGVSYLWSRNDGGTTFTGTTSLPGGETGIADGEGATAADINNDGYLDFLWASSGTQSMAFVNDGDDTYTKHTNVDTSFGLPQDVAVHENMEWAWGDCDNDADLDVYVSGADSEGLYVFNGTLFVDMTGTAGISGVTDPDGATWGDVDNDGDLDLLIVNDGGVSKLMLNSGSCSFTDQTMTWAIDTSSDIGKTAGFFDVDNDGDLDLISNNPVKLWRNDIDNSEYLVVIATGAGTATTSPVTPVGAQITVFMAGTTTVVGYREVIPSQNQFGASYRQHFGLDPTEEYDIKVHFPSGIDVMMSNIQPNTQTVDIGGNILNNTIRITEIEPNTFIWDGGGDGVSWSDPLNWVPNLGYPDDLNDKAVISSTTDAIVTPGALTVGEIEISGTFGGSLSLAGNLTIDQDSTQSGDLTLSSNSVEFNVLGYEVNIDGTLLVSTGTINASTSTISVMGHVNFTGGSFNEGLSIFTLSGDSEQTITSAGSNFCKLTVTNTSASGVTFTDGFTVGDLTNITPKSRMVFASNSAYIITNELDLNGGSIGNEVVLTSSSPPARFTFTFPQDAGVQTVDFVDVSNAEAYGYNIVATDSLDTLNNDSGEGVPEWVFSVNGSCGICSGGIQMIQLPLIGIQYHIPE